MSKSFYSIILPTYNEVENLPLVIYLIDKFMCKRLKNIPFSSYFSNSGYKYEVVIVDDNSKDGTKEVAEKLISFYGTEKLKLTCRKGKLGLGTAYFHGFKYTTGDFIFLMDADLSHHPKYLPEMIKKQKEGGFDFVTGTRYALNGGVFGWSYFRKFTSKCANWLAQTLLNPGVSDLTGSYRLYKRSVFQEITKYDLPKGYAFQMAIAVRLKRLGFTCGEVPIEFVDRIYGSSKLSAKEITNYLKGVFKLFFSV